MVIGKHECQTAGNTRLKKTITIGLEEVLTALEESFHDLTDQQAQGFPVPSENNIAWIVMHCLDNLDGCAGHWAWPPGRGPSSTGRRARPGL